MDSTEMLVNVAMAMLWFVFPLIPLAKLVMATFGLIVVALFFVGLFRFVMWGLRGRCW